ncbi:MAG: metallophosphoesterase [Candidatus Thermoplasmatota archaeon]|nr:metallophosphoesterase [Candidatus Thermoplasmatota archaeon]
MVRFVHISDIHLGQNEPFIKEHLIHSFDKAIDYILNNNIDFVIFAGDIFDSPSPTSETKIYFAKKLLLLKKNNIRVYYVNGSHDGTPAVPGDLPLFETFGVMKSVYRASYSDNDKILLNPVIDNETGIKLYGINGEPNGNDIEKYKRLESNRLDERSIFVFHNGIGELNDKYDNCIDSSLFPSGAIYYAGGHIHITKNIELNGKHFYFPGPLFIGFGSQDLENYLNGNGGGFYSVEIQNGTVNAEYTSIREIDGITIHIDANNLTSEEVISKIKEITPKENDVILIKIDGALSNGKLSDISSSKDHLSELLMDKGAKKVFFNIRNLTTKESEVIRIKGDTPDEIEMNILNENKEILEQPWIPEKLYSSKNFRKILNALATEKEDSESNESYENRIFKEFLEQTGEDLK